MQKTSYCRGTVCFRSNNAVSQAGVFVLDINGRSPCALLSTTHQIWVRSRRVPPYVLTVCIWMEASGQFMSLVCLPPGEYFLLPTEQQVWWTPEPVWTPRRRDNLFSCWESNPISQPFVGHNHIKLSVMVTHCCFQWESVVTWCADDPSDRGVTWLLACWDCGFESHRRHRSLFLMSVVYCQVEVCGSG